MPAIGDEFAGYKIEALLGKGGMGIVYRARHLRLDRPVALKLLPEDLTDDESFRLRFERESRLAAAMEHPNIIPIYEAGEREQLLYIVMRYVAGADLKNVIAKEGALAPERALSLVEQAASALDAAHERHLIHRDVKPHNMLISPRTEWTSEHLYLSDFGLAKKTSASAAITATGAFMGTIFYVSPEQIEGHNVGPPTDVYSLGCVFFECLTGKTPFQGESDVSIIGAHLNTPPPNLSQFIGTPPELDHVITTAMAKAPSERYSSCTDMIMDARSVMHRTGFEVTSTPPSGETRAAPPAHTLTAPVQRVDAAKEATAGTVPAPDFHFNRPGPAPLRASQVVADWPPPVTKEKQRRWVLPAVLTLVTALLAAAAGYFFLLRDDEGAAPAEVTFSARATSNFPGKPPRRIGEFRFNADKTAQIDTLPGSVANLGAAYRQRGANTFVNHYVVEYRNPAAAKRDYEDQIDFLKRGGFSIREEVPLKNAAGANVGLVALLSRTEPRREDAIVWTNKNLSAGVRGEPGEPLEFFNSVSY